MASSTVTRRHSFSSRVASLDVTKAIKRAWRSSKRTYSLAVVHESDSSSDTELTEEERRELEEIRKRKDELKREIQVGNTDIKSVAARRHLLTQKHFRCCSN
jgi:hypothetical protein